MMFVRTILGDIPPEQLGLTYSHEHVVIDRCHATALNADFLLNDQSRIVAELKEFYALGGRSMIDTMPVNCGRNVLLSANISRQSQVQLVVPTGLHLEQYYPPKHWRYQLNEDQLTQLFINDVELGIDRYDYNGPIVERTSHRAGLIKLATGDHPFSKHQELIFRAVVNTHRHTGVPILTHTEQGELALEQAKLFHSLGADLRHVVLSHVDRKVDLDYHRRVLDTGVRLEYDSAFRWKEPHPNGTYQLLKALLPKYSDQIAMGMDAARNTYWRSYGGSPGLSFLLTTFKNDLNNMGLGGYYDKIFHYVPQKLFTFQIGEYKM